MYLLTCLTHHHRTHFHIHCTNFIRAEIWYLRLIYLTNYKPTYYTYIYMYIYAMYLFLEMMFAFYPHMYAKCKYDDEITDAIYVWDKKNVAPITWKKGLLKLKMFRCFFIDWWKKKSWEARFLLTINFSIL